ncbi:MAG: dephospho-CoA kinase [Opitutaceae bacterium]
MIIGITGGMGCGKSAVAAMFERQSFQRIDSDALVRGQVLTLPAVIDRLRDRFGQGVITKEGVVDRAQLAQRAFAHESDRLWLEELTHPLLFELWREKMITAPTGLWAVEVPLLFEKNLENWFDFTLCVACAPNQQLARLEQRGLPHALAEQRISKQLPLARKIELADFVLWNDGTVQFLQDQVNELIHKLQVAS